VFVRGTLFLGHLTGDHVKDAKAAALAAKPTTPPTVVVGPANGPGTVVTTGAAPAKDKAKTA